VQTTVTEWNGLAPGDDLKVKGERGYYKFRSAALDENGEAKWITVIGGPLHHSSFRHFEASRVTAKKTGRRKKSETN
jgi:hypothetical protein